MDELQKLHEKLKERLHANPDDSRQEELESTGLVYLIRCSGSNCYKIGFTQADIRLRLSDLQTGCPFELIPIFAYLCPFCWEVEKTLHTMYRENCVGGEWFRLTSKEVEEAEGFIESHRLKRRRAPND